MSDPFLSEIRVFSFSFPPRNWALCQGQLLPINQNQALFALLGTTYGGNGQTTFALPDLRGRLAISQGQGAGLTSYLMGERAGAETETVSASEMPSHTHSVTPSQLTGTVPCKGAPANQRGPGGNVAAAELSSVPAPYSTLAADGSESPSGVAPTIAAATAGGGQPHPNMQPYLVLNYCIAL